MCTLVHPQWKLFSGCGHSFHLEGILPNVSTFPVCKATLQSNVQTLGRKANDAVFDGSFDEDEAVDDVKDSGEADDDGEASGADVDEEVEIK